MQLHQDAPLLASSQAKPKAEQIDRASRADALKGTGQRTGQSTGAQWRYAGAFTGAAAVASAGIVLPLAGESAVAYSGLTEGTIPQVRAAASDRATQGNSQSQPLAPQIAQAKGVRFSESTQRRAAGSPEQSTQPSQPSLITRGEDGSWTLAYESQAGYQPQQVIAQLAKETAQSAQAQRNCSGGSCQSLAYIAAQLPQAQQRLQTLQQAIQKFEAQHGQQDMAAYQEVLTGRISEITQQNTQLQNSLEQTRRNLLQLKMRLATVEADAGMAEQILSEDGNYQVAWMRLQRAEENLLAEFSKADLDATTLNEIYADYRYQQQQLQRAAQAALGSYLTAPDTVAPSFVYQAPAALDIMQDLVITTHQYQVQQLRQDTIDEIEQRLQGRQKQLLENLGQYEQLQRELTIAKQSVAQYQQEGDRLSNNSQTTDQPSPSAMAVPRARTLALQLPDGTVGKTVLGVVVAAGAIAAAVARQQAKKAAAVPSAAVSSAAIPPFRPTVDSNTLHLLQQPLVGASRYTSVTPERTPERISEQADLVTQLLEMTGQSPQVISASVLTQADTAEDDLTIELMVRELDDILDQATAEASFADAVSDRSMPPVRLSLKEVDLFAEHAVRWVLKDLGLNPDSTEPMAEPVRLEPAEYARAT
ncbi:hypothetical protein BH23CYA1_BH23CYA1_14580 [soil metagenome]